MTSHILVHVLLREHSLVEDLTRTCLITADTVVLICTWVKTFRQWRAAPQFHIQLSVSSCLLRDGGPSNFQCIGQEAYSATIYHP